MPNIDVNGQTIDYPDTGDPNWGDNATNFAIQTSAALGKIGLSSGTSVDITQTLDVTGNTTLDANLSVGGNASVTGTTSLTGNVTLTNNLTVNGNTLLGNANTDTIGITGIVNVDSGTLYVDPATNRVGINDTTPSEALDVTGNVSITGNETVGGTLNVTGATTLSSTLGVTGDVAINTNKFNVTASSGNTTIAGTLGVTSDTTIDGVIYADDNTTANTPVISFTGDANTGIGRSAADTLDYVTGGVSRSRLNSTGQQSSVIPDLSASNTTLYNEYKCRAWVNFNGSTLAVRGSGNVTSVTRNGGAGRYRVNFINNMPDVNYCAVASDNNYGITNTDVANNNIAYTDVYSYNISGTLADIGGVSVAVFR